MKANQPDQEPDDVPRELAASLKQLHAPSEPPAREVDDAILAAARARLAELEAPKPRALPRIWKSLVAASAAALLLWFVLDPSRVSGDLDGDGQVNVLDAFQLARALRDGEPGGLEDCTGDGQVDGADVVELMERAVQL